MCNVCKTRNNSLARNNANVPKLLVNKHWNAHCISHVKSSSLFFLALQYQTTWTTLGRRFQAADFIRVRQTYVQLEIGRSATSIRVRQKPNVPYQKKNFSQKS